MLVEVLKGVGSEYNPVYQPEQLKKAFEIWSKYVEGHRILENIQKYTQILDALDKGLSVAQKVAQYFFMQSCIIEPLIEERISA